MTHYDDLHADELSSVVEQLRANRPVATPLELDAVKRRVRGRVASRPAGRRARSAAFMKSRLAILSMLVTGLVLSTTGAGLAVNGLTSRNDAAKFQYYVVPGGDNGGVLGEGNSNAGGGGGVAGQGNGGGGGVAGENAVQPARQVEAGAGSENLPFTGFLAIPVLLGGVALLSAGLVLRRRAADDR
jgi:hypothetical protein